MKGTHASTMRTVPAQPGFAVVDVIADNSGRPISASSSPVVAWAFEHDLLIPYPVTLCGVQTGSVFILQPDGSVERPNVVGFADIDAWLSYEKQGFDERLERAV